jgi:hypothetical protein
LQWPPVGWKRAQASSKASRLSPNGARRRAAASLPSLRSRHRLCRAPRSMPLVFWSGAVCAGCRCFNTSRRLSKRSRRAQRASVPPRAVRKSNPLSIFRPRKPKAYCGWDTSAPVLHLWLNDLVPDPERAGHALVVLNHPAEAKVQDTLSARRSMIARKKMLARDCGLEPRNEVTRDPRGLPVWRRRDVSRFRKFSEDEPRRSF